MYEDLTAFERALARFGDKVALIAGMEISDKITPEDAYQAYCIAAMQYHGEYANNG